MDVVNLLIKSASSGCNLDCQYCFYHDVSNHRQWVNRGIMQDEVVTKLVQKALMVAKRAVIFSFQGGEPLLAGLHFYQKFIEKVQLYNHNHCQIIYSIQTNGILIDKEWCHFFKENNFLVGVSLDGPDFVHNQNRIDQNKIGTFAEVMKKISLLKEEKVEFNILTVITADSIQYTNEILSFFKEQAFSYLQFIPYVPKIDLQENDPLLVQPKDYEQFLNILLDWWENALIENQYVSIRYFDNLIGLILGYHPQSCDLIGHCSNNLVVESDGSVYPCDFYVTDEWLLGSIIDDSLEDIITHPNSKKFIEQSIIVSDACKKCPYYMLCKGGCKRYKEIINQPYYCESYYTFFQKNMIRLEQIAERIQSCLR